MGRHVINRYNRETVARNTVIDQETGCWLWSGYIQTGGYGQIEVCGRLWLAHRFVWFVYHDEVEPVGLMLHRCDTPACVNPEHLFEGTHMDNHKDAVAKGRVDPMAVCRHSHKPRRRKLTDDQVRQIRSGRDSDQGYALRFGVAANTVCDIRNRRSKTLIPD